MSDETAIKTLQVVLPRPVALATVKAAARFKKNVDGYIAGAILRQLLDDGAIDRTALGRLF
jgi:hypothetical protein